jgi:hypothetical protein
VKDTSVTVKKTEPRESPTDVVQSMLIAMEIRRDGLMRCEVVSGSTDSSSLPKSEFKARRLFLREFHRALEQAKGFVFRGSINNMGG